MVTIDNTIVNVDEFTGDIEAGRVDYERAKQGTELVKTEMSALEERLKAYTGFDTMNLPEGTEVTTIRRGDVSFEVKSQKRTKRPQYKTAVTEMENHLTGISFLLSQGRAITGIVVEDDKSYIAVDKLLEAYEIIVAGITNPEVKHTIRYELNGVLAEELEGRVEEIELRDGRNPAAMTGENFANYARMDHLVSGLTEYVKEYEKALSKGQRKGSTRTTAITNDKAYKSTKAVSTGTDWAYVVGSLISLGGRHKEVGELNQLNDDRSFSEKRIAHDQYDLLEREVRGRPSVYVSMQSVYQRIQGLKGEQMIIAQRQEVVGKDIV